VFVDCVLQVLTARIKVLGLMHPDTLQGMNNYGHTLGRLGKHADAEAMKRQVGMLCICFTGQSEEFTN